MSWQQGSFRAGFTVKGLSDAVMTESVATASVDLGVSAVYEGLTAGLALRNAGGRLRKLKVPNAASIPTDGLPGETRLGVAYRYAPWSLAAGAEYVGIADAAPMAGAGVEYWPARSFAVRAGLAGISGAAQQQITLGFTALVGGVSLDYALGAHPLGPVHRASLSYAFGAPEAEESADRHKAAVPRPDTPALRHVAVARLHVSSITEKSAASIAGRLRAELGKIAGIESLSWEAMNKPVAAKRLLAKGCAMEDCGASLGRALGTDFVVVGSVGKVAGSYFVSTRVVDVATGRTITVDEARGATAEALSKGIKALAGRLAKKLR